MPRSDPPLATRIVRGLARLRRRREVEWLALYLGAAWIIYEAVGLTVDTFALSVTVVRVTAVLLGLGAFIAVPLAHWYELTARAVEQAGGGALSDVPGVPDVLEPALTRSYRRVRRRTVVLAGAGSTVLFSAFFFVLWTSWVAGHETPVTDSRISMVVFPFRGSGVEAAGYGEGLADLLSTTLDGTAGVRVSDPAGLWKELRPERGEPALAPELDEALRLSREAGVRRFVTGGVVAVGSSLDVTARVYDAETGQALTSVQTAAHEDSLATAVHRVAIDLLAGIWEREQLPSVPEIERFATDNAEALKAYLEAKSLKRRGLFTDGLPVIERAVALDTTFALAHLEHFSIRSQVLYLNNEGFVGLRPIINRAMQYRERLTPRNRMRIEANLALDDTDGVRAAFLFERILSIDSLDVDALHALAYTYLRDGWMLGKKRDDIIGAFDRALRVDPSSVITRATRARLALMSEDSTELQRELAVLRSIDTTSAYVRGTLGAVRALMAPQGDVGPILSSLSEQPLPVVTTVLRELRTNRPALAERYVDELRAQPRPVTHRRTGLGGRIQLWLAEGRMAGVDSLIATGEYDRLRPVLNRILVTASLAGLGDRRLSTSAAAELAAFAPAESLQALLATSPYRVWAIAWAVAAYQATFADTAEARTWQRALAELPTGDTWWDWTGALTADIEARLAVRRDDMESAEREARRAHDLWQIKSNYVGEAHPEPAMRLHLAEILQDRGALDQAEWLYRSLTAPHGWVGFYTARASFELGRIMEARGDREEAQRHYLAAIRLWERGEAGVIGQWLTRAQEGLQRLRSELPPS